MNEQAQSLSSPYSDLVFLSTSRVLVYYGTPGAPLVDRGVLSSRRYNQLLVLSAQLTQYKLLKAPIGVVHEQSRTP